MILLFGTFVYAGEVSFYDGWIAAYKKSNVEELTQKVVTELKRKSAIYQGRTGISNAYMSSYFWENVTSNIEAQVRATKMLNTERVLPKFFKEYTTYEYLENEINSYVGFSGHNKKLMDTQSRLSFSNLDSQAEYSSSNAIQLDLEASTLKEERGLPGAKNGLINHGEWVTLSLGFVNTSQERWYSSSVFLIDSSECFWMLPQRGWKLAEMDPGEKSFIDVEMFVSEDCSVRPSLSFRVSDSAFGKQSADKVVFSIKNPMYHSLKNIVLERDNLGFSDGERKGIIEDKTKMEVRTELGFSSDVSKAMGEYSIPGFLEGIFTRASLDRGDLLPADGAWSSVDDWDIEAAASIRPQVLKLASKYGWKKKEQSELLVAYDVLVEGKSSGASTPSKTKEYTVEEILELIPSYIKVVPNEVIRGDTGTKVDTIVTKNDSGNVLTVETVQKPLENLVKTSGTQILFDKEGLRLRVASNQSDDRTVPEQSPVETYVQRSFFTIPLDFYEVCGDGVDNDDDLKIDCDDSDCAQDYACNFSAEICNDRMDNDQDGAIDCEDTDCENAFACRKKEICTDGLDNDEDGKIDCEDADCRFKSYCEDSSSPLLSIGMGTVLPTFTLNYTTGENFQYYFEAQITPFIETLDPLANQFSALIGFGYKFTIANSLHIFPSVGGAASLIGYNEFVSIGGSSIDSTMIIHPYYGLQTRLKLSKSVFMFADWKSSLMDTNGLMDESTLSGGFSFVLP